jgi:hypothetical protein
MHGSPARHFDSLRKLLPELAIEVKSPGGHALEILEHGFTCCEKTTPTLLFPRRFSDACKKTLSPEKEPRCEACGNTGSTCDQAGGDQGLGVSH